MTVPHTAVGKTIHVFIILGFPLLSRFFLLFSEEKPFFIAAKEGKRMRLYGEPITKNNIGRPASAKYTQLSDFKTVYDFLDFAYGNENGFSFICLQHTIEKNGKVHKPMSQIAFHGDQRTENNFNKYMGLKNVFFTPNLFLGTKRLTSEVKTLNFVFADLDCDDLNIPPEVARDKIIYEFAGSRLPIPTIMNYSGHGLHVYWKIREDKEALPRWNTIQKHINKVLTELNADRKAIDVTRIMRLPETFNSDGDKAEICWFCNVEYTLYEIAVAYGIEKCGFTINRKRGSKKRATKKQIEKAMELSEHSGKPLPDFTDRKATSAFIEEGIRRERALRGVKGRLGDGFAIILKKRLEDLAKLAKLRRGVDCGREMILFLVRLWTVELTGDLELARQAMLDVNKLFGHPLKNGEALSHTAQANKTLSGGVAYKYTDAHVMELLKITEEEQSQLDYFNAKRFQSARKFRYKSKEWRSNKNRICYLNALERQGETTKADKIAERRERVKGLLKKGLSRSAIAKELGFSVSTIRGDIKALQAEGFVVDAPELSFAPVEDAAAISKESTTDGKTVNIMSEDQPEAASEGKKQNNTYKATPASQNWHFEAIFKGVQKIQPPLYYGRAYGPPASTKVYEMVMEKDYPNVCLKAPWKIGSYTGRTRAGPMNLLLISASSVYRLPGIRGSPRARPGNISEKRSCERRLICELY